MFAVVHEFVNATYKAQITLHMSGQRCNPFYLAGAIRHAFAHGLLSATPSKAPQKSVATVSRYLCRMLMRVMDREFEQRMIDFEAGLPS
jgi:hypothetical protein